MTAIAGTRLTELARELKMTIAELVTALKDLGVTVTGPNSIIDNDTANTVRGLLGKSAVSGKVAEVAADATVKDIAQAIGVQPNAAQRHPQRGRLGDRSA